MKKRNQGLTLIEMVVVVAIIGILAVIFFSNLYNSIRNYELRDAASQVAADFRNARSIAQKGSMNTTISWTGTSTSSFSTYTITQGTNVTTAVIPNGVTVTCSGCTGANFAYTAPYGELQDFTGKVFTVASPTAGITPMEVRVVGVTGKVILARQGS